MIYSYSSPSPVEVLGGGSRVFKKGWPRLNSMKIIQNFKGKGAAWVPIAHPLNLPMLALLGIPALLFK